MKTVIQKILSLTTLITLTSSYTPFQDTLQYNKVHELEITKDTKTTSFKFFYENERIYLKNITHYVVLNFRNSVMGEHGNKALSFQIQGRNNDADVRNYFDSSLLSLGKDTDQLFRSDYSSHWIFNENYFVVPLNLFKSWEFSIDVDPKVFAKGNFLEKKVEFGIGIFSEENIEVHPDFVVPGYLSKETEGMVITIPRRKYKAGNSNYLELSVCRGLLGSVAVIRVDQRGTRNAIFEKSEFESNFLKLDIEFEDDTEVVLVKVSKMYRGDELFFKTRFRSLGKQEMEVVAKQEASGGQEVLSLAYDDLSYSYVKVRRELGPDVRLQRNEVYELNGVQRTPRAVVEGMYDEETTRIYAFDDKSDAEFSSVCGFHANVFSHYLGLNETVQNIQSFSSIQLGYGSAKIQNPGTKGHRAPIIDLRRGTLVKKRKNDLSENLANFKNGVYIFTKTLKAYSMENKGLAISIDSSPIIHLGQNQAGPSSSYGDILLFYIVYPLLFIIACKYTKNIFENRQDRMRRGHNSLEGGREIEITSSSSDGRSGFESIGKHDTRIDNSLQDEDDEDDDEFSSDDDEEDDDSY